MSAAWTSPRGVPVATPTSRIAALSRSRVCGDVIAPDAITARKRLELGAIHGLDQCLARGKWRYSVPMPAPEMVRRLDAIGA